MARDFSNRSGSQSVKEKVSPILPGLHFKTCYLCIALRQRKTSTKNVFKKWVRDDSIEDTSFNIGTDDVTVDVKVYPDEFSLEEEKYK